MPQNFSLAGKFRRGLDPNGNIAECVALTRPAEDDDEVVVGAIHDRMLVIPRTAKICTFSLIMHVCD